LPPAPPVIAVATCTLDESAGLDDWLTQPIESARPLSMERCNQSFGYIFYRTILGRSGAGVLEIDELHDYATVLLDRKIIGYLDRRLGQSSLQIEAPQAHGTLEILVENCGRINYGPLMNDERKGITRSVRWNDEELLGWQNFPLPFDSLPALRFSRRKRTAPAFHRGFVKLRSTGDTFLNTGSLGKGVMFVNGHNAGRYWRLGPQRSLYIPGTWLREGINEIVTFDIATLDAPTISGTNDPERPTTTGVYCPGPAADN
ncbi:MAG: beta-galactosidase, partial [Candidatus Eremiobacteraeota bacterium]|nr:beta-galactosidase [Candidatus Eremiobacteraeota bacterium]